LDAEPPSKPMIAPAPEAAQQVVFVPQTTSLVVVPSAKTYSVSAVHVLWAAQQPASSKPEALNLPTPHSAHVPALPTTVSVPTMKPVTALAPETAQHTALSPHVESESAAQLLEKYLLLEPVHVVHVEQQAPAASSPETENWVPSMHGLQVLPAAPSLDAEPGS
jgi:hypothetical protein